MLLALLFCAQSDVIRPVHTYSIVAVDTERGEMGVAVQSHWFSVGSVVTWAEPGVGVVATQSLVDPSYGPLGLALMGAGKTPAQALEGLLAADENADVRQVAFANAMGDVAAHTGAKCIAEAGHQTGTHFSVQANIMDRNTVWPEMAKAFQQTQGDLATRMLAALQAAEAQGGDLRGKQSAAMLVVKTDASGMPWRDKILDLRVEDHPDPLAELDRLINVSRAYHHMDEGDGFIAAGDLDSAMNAYRAAMALMPQNAEIAFWSAATMASNGHVDAALPLFRIAFEGEPRLRRLVPRLVKPGFITDDAEILKKIDAVK
ncbi:MAG: DUF1028 domain-containing protein [Acidobacteria bacterium]|nr:DUF1028 domain-containing protein [Acidobacteriota bacterium]